MGRPLLSEERGKKGVRLIGVCQSVTSVPDEYTDLTGYTDTCTVDMKIGPGRWELGRIEIEQGDIARFEAGALVNAANNRLWMGGGVAGALKRTGGPEVEAEALARGPIPVGEAVATTAGKLRAKHVIHAAVMGQDLRTDAEKVRQATMNSLLRADELDLESIAFPALGTGVGGFPLDECARIMIEVVQRHLAEGSGLERVVFVLYDKPAYLVFRRELERQEGLAERP
jgi:O-acetyl-ADP-ribose deacetylase (regulator of RNase III)